MHTCISSHGLKRSWRSCPRRVNAGNKNTPSTHHPRRWNVTTLMAGLKKRSHTQKSHPKVVNPRGIAGERKKTTTPPLPPKNKNKLMYFCTISCLCFSHYALMYKFLSWYYNNLKHTPNLTSVTMMLEYETLKYIDTVGHGMFVVFHLVLITCCRFF